MTVSSLYTTHTIICKVPQSSSEHRCNHKDQGGFPMPHKKGHLLVDEKKGEKRHWISLWAWLSYYTLDAVSIHTVTTKIQASFLTQLPERKITAQGFYLKANVDIKGVTECNGCDIWKLRMDQQPCNYSTEWKEGSLYIIQIFQNMQPIFNKELK